jgi:hypothetical protein
MIIVVVVIIIIIIIIVIIILTLHGLDGARLDRRGLFETCTPSRSTITRPWTLILSLARSLSLSRSPNLSLSFTQSRDMHVCYALRRDAFEHIALD